MPIHIYFCNFCKTQKSRKSSFEDIKETIVCPNCFKQMQKQLFAPAIHYKGNGFASTDKTKSYDPFNKDDLDKGMEKHDKALDKY